MARQSKPQSPAQPRDIKSSPTGAALFLAPSVTLLVKIGSMIVHADEFTEPGGHEFDIHTFKTLMKDPEVAAWLAAGSASAMLPKKRSDRT